MLALSVDGTVCAWGSNAAGQLCLGHLSSIDGPESIEYDKSITSIAAGSIHAAAVTCDGEVFARGNNHHGQLGRRLPRYATTPLPVAIPECVRSVAAGMHFCPALGRSGRVYAWGWNGHGQLGSDNEDRSAPTRIEGLEGIRSVANGETHVVVIADDGLWG